MTQNPIKCNTVLHMHVLHRRVGVEIGRQLGRVALTTGVPAHGEKQHPKTSHPIPIPMPSHINANRKIGMEDDDSLFDCTVLARARHRPEALQFAAVQGRYRARLSTKVSEGFPGEVGGRLASAVALGVHHCLQVPPFPREKGVIEQGPRHPGVQPVALRFRGLPRGGREAFF